MQHETQENTADWKNKTDQIRYSQKRLKHTTFTVIAGSTGVNFETLFLEGIASILVYFAGSILEKIIN